MISEEEKEKGLEVIIKMMKKGMTKEEMKNIAFDAFLKGMSQMDIDKKQEE